MALSELDNPRNLPAAIERSPIASLDSSVIRLRIGPNTYGIPLRDVGMLLDANMPDFVTGDVKLSGKDQAVRSGIKALVPAILGLLGKEVQKASEQMVAQGAAPLPLPDLRQRHHDLLDYAVRYLALLILSLLASHTWEATIGDVVEGAGGYIRLSGLSGSVAHPATPDDDDNGPDAA